MAAPVECKSKTGANGVGSEVLLREYPTIGLRIMMLGLAPFAAGVLFLTPLFIAPKSVRADSLRQISSLSQMLAAPLSSFEESLIRGVAIEGITETNDLTAEATTTYDTTNTSDTRNTHDTRAPTSETVKSSIFFERNALASNSGPSR